MGFEDALRRRLGPMRDLVRFGDGEEVERPDPATLWYRRAVGIEVRVRPEETWAEVDIAGHDGTWRRMSVEDARTVLGLTDWRPASEIDAKPATLWRWVEQDLLFWSATRPKGALVGTTDAGAHQVARRASMWPTLAMEGPVAIAPIPFMPRGEDLRDAKLAGLRFASREKGHEVLGVSITGGERTGRALRALLPALDGRADRAALLDAAPRLVPLLEALTVLEPSRVQPMLDEDAVTWLGHAGVLLGLGGKNVLVDPVFFAGSEPPEHSMAPFDPRRLPRIDLVLITHGDNDHLNPNALAHLPSATPIVVPPLARRPLRHQVDIRGLLGLLGFDSIVELAPWESLPLGPLEITACPFVGEDWGLALPQSTYLVSGPGFSAFFAADSFRMDDTYRRLAERKVDLAFMGIGGCSEALAMPARFGYGNFYRDWIPRVRQNEWVQHCAGPEDALHSLSLFAPRFAFGYAAGGAPFIETAYSDTGSHAALAALLERSASPTRPVSLPIGIPVHLDQLGMSSVVRA